MTRCIKKISRIKRVLLCLILWLFVLNNESYSQQITTNTASSLEALIQDNLGLGCVDISNISSSVNGQINGLSSFGYFEKNESNFPFENGIILSTGSIISAGNTINTAILNEGSTNWGTDPDLETTLGLQETLNATSIEFDFISIVNQIQFNYILASEEYFGNFPCQPSDGLAFLIKKAGTSDPYVNLSVVPETSIPVNTNTIHEEIVGFCAASNEQFFEGYNVGETNYNGRTIAITASADIEPNVQYHIKLIIADQNDKNYDSAVFIQGNSFTASVDLGEDIQTCSNAVTLDAHIDNPQAIYSWFLDENIINGATEATYDATTSGVYRVAIEIPIGLSSCNIEDAITVTLSTTQSAEPISDYELCDDLSGDEIESFDLSLKDSEVLATVPASSYSISYHFTANDAQNGIAGVSGIIQNLSNPQTIYVRIEDTIDGCLAFQDFNLIVNPLPIITEPTPLLLCDDSMADGITSIDLAQKNEEITNGNFDLNVSYHLTPEDANSGANALSIPYTNINATETLYVNITNSITGCTSTTSLNLEILETPSINGDLMYIDACDIDLDGFATFDLTTIIDDVLQGTTNVMVTYHDNQEEASLGLNPIFDPTNYTNTTANKETIFIRVENNTTGCAAITTIEIHTNVLLTGTSIGDFSACDEDNDNVETFNLDAIEDLITEEAEIILNYSIALAFYESEEDRDNQVNPLDANLPYNPLSNPQEIFITLTSPTCQVKSQFSLIIDPIIEFDAIENQTFCDTDQDGFAVIDLSSYDDLITNDQSSEFEVSYYISEEDAEGIIAVLPASYLNVTNPFTLFARITSLATNCADITSFEIEVLPAPLSNQPNDILICDDDQDGVSIINLNGITPEVLSDLNNRMVSFHNSQSDAELGSNAITNLAEYPAVTESMFIRIENTLTGCISVERFEIIVNTIPFINQITLYKFCEDGEDGFGEFLFSTQDMAILNGQTGKDVLYFENAIDAENSTDPINKNAVYVNTSNPQTIFYRIENITDPSCYSTSSFPIEIGTNPTFNEPTDIFICDDDTNDGSVNFDLNIQILEISAGIPDIEEVTFHTSRFNAENNVDPLPLNFSNTVNPQQIYVRISNGSICDSYASFVINVNAPPNLNPAQPLLQCDADYDGITTFDLTLFELEISDDRQEDNSITYHETEEGAFLNTSQITSPENYTNLTNPQTVFVRFTNIISGCFAYIPLELIVNLPPAIIPIETFETCDTTTVDLTTINTSLLLQTTNVVVDFFATEDDALNQVDQLETNYTYLSNNDLIFARVRFSTTQCFIIHSFNLVVNPIPIANQPSALEHCDDDFDGMYTFDLTQQNNAILGSQDPDDFSVFYFSSQENALEHIDALPSNYNASNTEIIFARVENKTTSCYSITSFQTVVRPKPDLAIPNQVICLNDLPLLVSAQTDIAGDTYLWSTDAITPEIEITETGLYAVTVTSNLGCETTSVFTVSESESATIDFTESIDFSDPNNVIVTISGIGNYFYQLDDEDPQQSNVFENVSLGYHTITIIDLNGCSEVSKEIVVIDAPKFFTPNDDSYFDTWHITGVETLPGTVVYIYDRYGKLLTALNSNDKGWNGYYNGNLMPASDYWFVANVKKNNIEFQVKGHFALRL